MLFKRRIVHLYCIPTRIQNIYSFIELNEKISLKRVIVIYIEKTVLDEQNVGFYHLLVS